MKTVSAMTMRRQFGGLLDEVRLTSETIVIERDGKPVAMLVPMPSSAEAVAVRERRHAALVRLCSLAKSTPRGRDATRWVAEEQRSLERSAALSAVFLDTAPLIYLVEGTPC